MKRRLNTRVVYNTRFRLFVYFAGSAEWSPNISPRDKWLSNRVSALNRPVYLYKMYTNGGGSRHSSSPVDIGLRKAFPFLNVANGNFRCSREHWVREHTSSRSTPL